MTASLLCSSGVIGVAGSYVTPARDTTGAKLICLGYSSASDTPGISDSESNTGWTQAIVSGAGQYGNRTCIYYKINPVTDANHTFSVTGGGNTNVFLMAAFTDADLGIDTGIVNSNAPAEMASTIQPGSVDPSVDFDVIFSMAGFGGGITGTPSVDSGFTIPADNGFKISPSDWSGACAYLIQGAKGAVNPTFTWQQADTACIAAFKAHGTSRGPNMKWTAHAL